MIISNNKHILANEEGYTVVVEILDKINYVWVDNTQDNLEFKFVINKMIPILYEYPTFSSVYAGQVLDDVKIIGGRTSVSGQFSWENPNQKLTNGQNNAIIVFTPEDI